MFRIFSILVVMLLLSGTVTGNDKAYLNFKNRSDIDRFIIEPVNWHSSNPEKLLTTLNKLYFNSERLNYEPGIVYANTLLGYFYNVSGNDHLSMLYWRRALKHAQRKDKLGPQVINIYLTIALAFVLDDRCDEAVYWLQQASHRVFLYRSYYQTDALYLYDQFRISNLYAHLYFRKRDVLTGDVYLSRSKLFRVNQDARVKFINEYNQVYRSLALGQYQACKIAVNNCIQITRALYPDDAASVPYYILLGKISVELKEYKKIYAYAKFVKSHYRYAGYLKKRIAIERLLIVADSATGNFLSAFSRQSHLQSLTDSIHNRSKIQLAKFYENELQVINVKDALRIEQIHSRQKENYIIIISVASILILIFVYLWLRAINLNQRRIHQKEKLEFSNDIHDGINPILSYIRAKLASHEQGQNVDVVGLVKMLDSAIHQTRKLSSWIRSSDEYYDLESGLLSSVETYKQTYHIDVDFHYKVAIIIPQELKQQIAFITDELLLNTWKHTKASRNLLHFYSSGKALIIIYGDNGGGFDLDADYEGVGLVSIQHRTHRHKGTLIYGPAVVSKGLSYQLTFTFLLK